MGDDSTGVDARDSRHALASAPLAETLDGGPVAVVEGDIGDDNTSALDMRGLEVLEQVELVSLVGGNTVVADEGLGEDENLAAVREIGHGLGVTDKRGGENSLSRDVGVGAEGLALEDGTILEECQQMNRIVTASQWLKIARTRMVKVAGREGAGVVARAVL